MNLLDLPAEIFAPIIHNYLHDYLYNGRGWAVAVRARYVCKAFAVAIHDDMFGRYSASFYRSFSDDRKQRLLAPNVYTILSKMGPTRCRSTYILDHMKPRSISLWNSPIIKRKRSANATAWPSVTPCRRHSR